MWPLAFLVVWPFVIVVAYEAAIDLFLRTHLELAPMGMGHGLEANLASNIRLVISGRPQLLSKYVQRPRHLFAHLRKFIHF